MQTKIGLPVKVEQLKKFIPLAILVFVGVLSVIGFLMLAKNLDFVRNQFYEVQKELELYRSGVWRLNRMDFDQLNQELAALHERFPSSEKIGAIIGELSEKAKEHQIEIEAITPGQKTQIQEVKSGSLDPLETVPVQMQLNGTYENIAAFLASFDDLKSNVATVQNFQLASGGQKQDSGMKVPVTASLFVKKNQKKDLFKEPVAEERPAARQAGKSRLESFGQNPFVKSVPIAQKASGVDINLEGIIYDPKEPIVLINGEARRTGDEVGNTKIVSIFPDHVVFERNGQQFEQRLSSE